MRRPSVTIEDGPVTPRQVLLNPEGRTEVGRSPACAIALDDPSVSRRHAELAQDSAGRWGVCDLGSHNGTRVNGVPVTSVAVLSDGDVIAVGAVRLRFTAGVSNPHWATLAGDAPGVTVAPLDRRRLPSRISADHVKAILAFGRDLDTLPDAGARLDRLVQLVAGEQIAGTWSVALQVTQAPSGQARPTVTPLCNARQGIAGITGEPHISETALRAVLTTGEPVVAGNLVPAARFQAELSVLPPHSPKLAAIACPLRPIRAGAANADVLYVLLAPHLAGMEWLTLVTLAVEQYRGAEAAWAAREAVAARAAADREMALAQAVQSRTLPTDRVVPGLDWAIRFDPCLAVAGDYVDVIPREDGRVLLVVADASGKGMQAALITAGLHAVFNTQGRTVASLAKVVDAAAAYLRAFLPTTSFVTLSAVLLDPVSGAGTCVNCGHPPMLVIGREGVREVDGGDNLPLGVGDDPTRSAPLCLAPGEWLAGYTDGLTELSDDAGRMSGVSEFTRQVAIACHDAPSAGAAASAIRAWAQAYRGSSLPGDDQTFMVARLLGSG